jgi:hypothetical protein
MTRSENQPATSILTQLISLDDDLSRQIEPFDIRRSPIYQDLQQKLLVMKGQVWKSYSLAIDDISTKIKDAVGNRNFGEDEIDYDVLPLFFAVNREDIVRKILATYGLALSDSDFAYYRRYSTDLRWQLRVNAEYFHRSYQDMESQFKKITTLLNQLSASADQKDDVQYVVERAQHPIVVGLARYRSEMEVYSQFSQGHETQRRPRTIPEMRKTQLEVKKSLSELINMLIHMIKDGKLLPVSASTLTQSPERLQPPASLPIIQPFSRN